MFEKLLKSAFDAGGDVFVYMNGFSNPLRGRVQDMEGEYFTLFQNGKGGTILWAFRLSDVLSCGLLVGLPLSDMPVAVAQALEGTMSDDVESSLEPDDVAEVPLNESED
jgi:hypothetical protein